MSSDGSHSTPNSARILPISSSPTTPVTQQATQSQEINVWRQAMQDPTHSQRYAQRWERIAAAGQDIDGEARAVDAIAERGAKILDAGSGNGRVAGYLAAAGHQAMGIDLDPYLVEVANTKYPQAHFQVADLADFELLDDTGQFMTFDVIVSAGNVQTFLASWERIPALTNISKHMHATTKFLTGFQLTRGYSSTQFTDDAQQAGLEVIQRFSTWQFDPFAEESSDFLLAVLQVKA